MKNVLFFIFFPKKDFRVSRADKTLGLLSLLFIIGILFLNFGLKKDLFRNSTGENFKSLSLHQVNATKNSAVDLSNYSLFDQDDFNGTNFKASIWDYRQLNTKRNNNVSYDSLVSSNVSVRNGILYLSVNHIRDNIFSASMISTELRPQYRFKYGYFEIRARLTQHYGSTCAFWLQSPTIIKETNNPSINGVEIDVMEYGKAAGKDSIFQSLVWNGYGAHQKLLSSHINVPGISTGFHVFALEWTPKEYITYIDGVETVRTSNAVSHRPEFIILNAGTGGFGGNPLNSGATFPDQFEVDYVKFYKRKPAVTLYGKNDFYGWVSSDLLAGSYTTAQLEPIGFINNDLSSIEVPAGWKVIVYDGDNFTGDSVVVTSDARSADHFDNRVSSLKIQNH